MKSMQKAASPGHGRGSHRLRDVLLYIVIGVLIALLAITLGVYQAKMNGRPDKLLKWVGFSVMTLLVFTWVIRRRLRSMNAQFWKLLGLFAVVHVILGVRLLLWTTTTSLIPFIIATPLEYILLSSILSRILPSEETDLQ